MASRPGGLNSVERTIESHAPMVQVIAPQECPQLPQLSGSDVPSMHWPAHGCNPVAQVGPASAGGGCIPPSSHGAASGLPGPASALASASGAVVVHTPLDAMQASPSEQTVPP